MVQLLTVVLMCHVASSYGFKMTVNLSDPSVPFEKFWTHTGFSPIDSTTEAAESLLLSKDERVNLALISALPNRAITHVRIHWLLNLLSKSPSGYDWSKFDNLLDWITAHDLLLIFEVMGKPNGLSKDKIDWNQLCAQITDHVKERYGIDVIRQWIFELWNEPDLKQYNILNFTLEDYKDYARSCIDGIRSSLPTAKIGGPAGLFKNPAKHKLCWGYLDECNSLQNRCRIDFISFHKKSFPYDLAREVNETMNTLKEKFKNLADLQFFNSESDLMTGWWKPASWRGDVSYAAGVAKLVDLLIPLNARGTKLMISNDNGFLNVFPEFFSQRTLLTRFNSTSPDSNQFIKKPVYIATGMLSFMAGRIIKKCSRKNSSFSVLPSVDQAENPTLAVLLLTNYEHKKHANNFSRFDVEIILPPFWQKARFSLHVLSNTLAHPRKVWKSHGKMEFPPTETREEMRKSEGPHLVLSGEVSRGMKLRWKFPSPSVGILQICSSKIEKPGKPYLLRALNISFSEVLLTWKDVDSRCISTYEIEYRHEDSNEVEPFKRINMQDQIFCSFQHVNYSGQNEENVRGYYRVRAISMWGTPGPYSSTLPYG
ncbi:Glycosyl hydrolases family 39 [Nesidiocoris tenuis]|uniref:Glycosyl hydrolases family 39 n=1 Tax=Nesidiocoris tenuis TaxID=355587 RepID=A0ABN7AA36_9HEMI|nr:Glycosyl hydrolases family 39 [Nesidiocoris tenuis]